jgi:hypothetical protein
MLTPSPGPVSPKGPPGQWSVTYRDGPQVHLRFNISARQEGIERAERDQQ